LCLDCGDEEEGKKKRKVRTRGSGFYFSLLSLI